MATIGNRLKALREARGLAQTTAARLLHSTKQTLYKYENDIITNIPYDKIVDAAKLYDVSPAYIMGWDEKKQEPAVAYPIIGEVAAGYGMDAVEEATGEYESIPVEWLRGHPREDWFVLRVKGDSMYPDFQDGDRVLVLRTTSVDSGSIAVILYDTEVATLKRVHYVYGEDWMTLEPLNREYVTKRITGQDLEQCRVLGQVKRLIRVVAE